MLINRNDPTKTNFSQNIGAVTDIIRLNSTSFAVSGGDLNEGKNDLINNRISIIKVDTST